MKQSGTIKKLQQWIRWQNWLEDIYRKCKINVTDNEKRKFYEGYIKSLNLGTNQDGGFYIKAAD